MFKLVSVPNFSLNWQFWYFGQNFLKKSISGLDQKSRSFAWAYDPIKLFRTGADKQNGILMSLLLLVAETIKRLIDQNCKILNSDRLHLDSVPSPNKVNSTVPSENRDKVKENLDEDLSFINTQTPLKKS